MSDEKIAVVLFNLGGPSSRDSIKPFLFNFFMDKNIIGAPLPVRWLLAKLISNRRSKKEAGDSYGFLGGKSPLLENTRKQAAALQQKLPKNFKVYISMRYWHPMSAEVIKGIKAWGAQRIIFMPLYPQYSTTTSFSSLEDWQKNSDLDIPTQTICCYPWQAGFVQASVENIKLVYEQAEKECGQPPRILFSAHGLPEKIIKAGDPYQWQCERSAEEIAKALDIKNLDWQICYQSRVGPLKWIGPSTEEALEKAAHDGVPVVIYPHAFTQEHVETLVELDIEYKHAAEKMGIKGYYRASTVGAHPAFIQGLADMVLARVSKPALECAPDQETRICPAYYGKCACRT